jgi:hypothetical protein
VTTWPPTSDYGPDCSWSPSCAFELIQIDHHRHCIGYIVGTPNLDLCTCVCHEERRASAKLRKPGRTDEPHWWRKLPVWRP